MGESYNGQRIYKSGVGLSEPIVTFDLGRILVAILRSRDS